MKRVVMILSVIAAVLALLVVGAVVSARQEAAQRPYQPLLSSEMTATAPPTSTGEAVTEAPAQVATVPPVSRRDQAAASQSSVQPQPAEKSASSTSKKTKETEKSADEPAKPTTGTLYGLTVEQRKACFYDLIAAEDRAVAEAETKFPMDADTENVKKNIELRFALQAQYEAEVAAKYGLTSEQLDKIAEEGIANSWPMPPLTE